MKKVLMFQDYFSNGGIEKVILDLKKYLDKNYQVDILSIVNKSNEKIIFLANKDYRNFLKRTVFGIFKYKKYLKNSKYDIIHIHCYNSFGLIYARIAKKYCDNIIVHAHNNSIDNDFFYFKRAINYIVKILFSSKKYTYIAVSEESSKFCFMKKNTIIINNGIDYKKYYFNSDMRKKYRKIFNIKNNEIVIGHIGRFEKQKNHKFIIDIFNEICKSKNNYKLILIGDGKLKNKINKMIRKMNLESKVITLNNRDDISNFMNAFDIYLFPSIYEGFGITVLENEVNGKYIFVSNRVVKDVIVSNRVKILSLEKKADIWANEIIKLKKDKILSLDNRLDIKTFINKIDNIYRGFDEKNTKV